MGAALRESVFGHHSSAISYTTFGQALEQTRRCPLKPTFPLENKRIFLTSTETACNSWKPRAHFAADTTQTHGGAMGIRLTDKTVRTLPPPPAGNQITYDTEALGFGARINACGARAFLLN